MSYSFNLFGVRVSAHPSFEQPGMSFTNEIVCITFLNLEKPDFSQRNPTFATVFSILSTPELIRHKQRPRLVVRRWDAFILRTSGSCKVPTRDGSALGAV